jgi:hypothetical protein
MAGTLVLVGDTTSGKIYKIGKIGRDSGSDATYDPDSTAFTGILKTERMSPAGENGLVRFRRVALRAFQSGPYTGTFTVWVDDIQTKTYDNSTSGVLLGSPLVDQTIEISGPPETDLGAGEVLLEADIDATGTFIQVQLELVSTDIQGYFLLESIEMNGQVIRQSRSLPAEMTDSGMAKHTAESS